MKENFDHIESHLPAGIDEKTLLQYLQGKLTPVQQHEVEKKILENDFELDAVEGLQELKNSQELPLIVKQLNRDLKRRTSHRKDHRQQQWLDQPYWLYLSIVIFLLLIIISYFIIHRHLHP